MRAWRLDRVTFDEMVNAGEVTDVQVAAAALIVGTDGKAVMDVLTKNNPDPYRREYRTRLGVARECRASSVAQLAAQGGLAGVPDSAAAVLDSLPLADL